MRANVGTPAPVLLCCTDCPNTFCMNHLPSIQRSNALKSCGSWERVRVLCNFISPDYVQYGPCSAHCLSQAKARGDSVQQNQQEGRLSYCQPPSLAPSILGSTSHKTAAATVTASSCFLKPQKSSETYDAAVSTFWKVPQNSKFFRSPDGNSKAQKLIQSWGDGDSSGTSADARTRPMAAGDTL